MRTGNRVGHHLLGSQLLRESRKGAITDGPEFDGRANSTNGRSSLDHTSNNGSTGATHSCTLQKAKQSINTPCGLEIRNE
jgi:hypothetical protein